MSTIKNKHCPICNKLIWSDSLACKKHYHNSGMFTSEDHPKYGLGVKAEKHPSWKGGRIKDVHGYIMAYTGNNGRYIKEHRLVIEKYLGRKLEKWEDVHHINGVKDDNRIKNLKIIDHSEHGRIHAIRQHST